MDERLIYVLVRFTETNVNYFAFSKQKQQSLEYSQAYQPYEVYFKRKCFPHRTIIKLYYFTNDAYYL